MTVTLEQTQSDLRKLVHLVQQGEEVVITSEGQPVAKLSGMTRGASAPDRQAWLARLRQLRASSATGKTSPTTESILNDLRSERE